MNIYCKICKGTAKFPAVPLFSMHNFSREDQTP